MKNKIFCCVISVCLICSLFLYGCASSRPDKSDQKDLDNRMNSVYGGDIDNSYEIIVDKETGIMYVSTCQGGICVMVDENGKPLKYNRK